MTPTGHPGTPSPESDERSLFARLEWQFRLAWSSDAPTNPRHYSLAGLPVQLRMASPALAAALGPALEHLVEPKGTAPTLSIDIWDGPPAPWELASGDELRSTTDRPAEQRVSLNDAPRALLGATGWIGLLSTDRTHALAWVPSAAGLTNVERAAPLSALLQSLLQSRGIELTHGAAVGSARGAVVLAGPGGVGKSTTALACVLAGLGYLGDDCILLANSPTPTVHSLYNSAKLAPDHANSFEQLSITADLPPLRPGDKAVWFVQRHFPEQLPRSAPLKAVLAPRQVDRATSRMIAISPGEALRALAPSTIFQLPGTPEKTLRLLGQMVRAVPSYRLELGRDLASIAEVITNLLATL